MSGFFILVTLWKSDILPEPVKVKCQSSHPDHKFKKTIVNQSITMVFLLVVENVVEKLNRIN